MSMLSHLGQGFVLLPFSNLECLLPFWQSQVGPSLKICNCLPSKILWFLSLEKSLNNNLVLVLFNRYLHDVHCVPEIALSSLQILSHVLPYNNPMSMVLLSLLHR